MTQPVATPQSLAVDDAIARYRRDVALGAAVRALLGAGAVAAIALNFIRASWGVEGTLLLLGVGAAWVALSFRSVRGSQLAAGSAALILAGRYDEAEEQLGQALRSFSIFRQTKTLTLHQLALLRHAQQRWAESAALCQALIAQRPRISDPIARACRLILGEALLELNDVMGVYQAIGALGAQPLRLGQTMTLLEVQVEYEARIGAWAAMGAGVTQKVLLAELMPAAASARVQAFLGLAAAKMGRADWANWLRRRVELLVDVEELCRQRPLLAELFHAPRAPADRIQPGL